MRRKMMIALGCLIALVTTVGAALAHSAAQPVNAPYPAVSVDTSAEGIARGRVLFEGTCAQCHRAHGASRAAGAPQTDVPGFLGRFHARNLTRHPTAGIGGFADRDIARLLRYGVTRDGRAAAMPTYGFSDSDLAAVLGFLRSDDPLFDADTRPSPASKPSLVGTMLIRSSLPDPQTRSASGLEAPPRGPTAAYGRYLAHEVFDCAGCHTPGFDPNKTSGEDLFRGGFEFTSSDGTPVIAPNLTPHADGIGSYSSAEFSRVLREGVKRDGTHARLPMPTFRGLGDDEVEALRAYLRAIPARANR